MKNPEPNSPPSSTNAEIPGNRRTHQDLPEDIIKQLAENKDRNSFIARHYAENKPRYGKTIVFAHNWKQCLQLSEFLKSRGVKTGTVFSHVDANLGSVDARNRQRSDENTATLHEFQRGNVWM